MSLADDIKSLSLVYHTDVHCRRRCTSCVPPCCSPSKGLASAITDAVATVAATAVAAFIVVATAVAIAAAIYPATAAICSRSRDKGRGSTCDGPTEVERGSSH